MALVVAWIGNFLCLCKGIKGSGKVAYVTVTMPVFLLVILFCRVITLPGAMKGIKRSRRADVSPTNRGAAAAATRRVRGDRSPRRGRSIESRRARLRYYITPRPEALWDLQIWGIACSQILFSLSPGLGTALALASYNPINHDIYRDNWVICMLNSAFSIFGGFVVFSVVGHVRRADMLLMNRGDAAMPLMNRGDAAAATCIFRGSQVVAAPRPRRGSSAVPKAHRGYYSVETGARAPGTSRTRREAPWRRSRRRRARGSRSWSSPRAFPNCPSRSSGPSCFS